MARAMICDRCGDFFKIEDVRHGENVNHFMMVGVASIMSGQIFDKKKYDLCPKCMESLIQWIDKFNLPGEVIEAEEQDNGKNNNQS